MALGYWPHYDGATVFGYLQSHGVLPLLGVYLVMLACVLVTVRFSTAAATNPLKSPMLFIVFSWTVFCLLNVAIYWALNVTFWSWYAVPVVFGLVICTYCGALFLLESGVSASRMRVLRAAILLISAVMLTQFGKVVNLLETDNVNPHLRAYSEIADFLKSMEPEGAVVETAEPGSLAFRLGPKFTVVDELGLTTPGVANASLKGDWTYASRIYNPDYVICSWPGIYSACAHDEVISRYRLVGEFDSDFWYTRLNRNALVFKRSD